MYKQLILSLKVISHMFLSGTFWTFCTFFYISWTFFFSFKSHPNTETLIPTIHSTTHEQVSSNGMNQIHGLGSPLTDFVWHPSVSVLYVCRGVVWNWCGLTWRCFSLLELLTSFRPVSTCRVAFKLLSWGFPLLEHRGKSRSPDVFCPSSTTLWAEVT